MSNRKLQHDYTSMIRALHEFLLGDEEEKEEDVSLDQMKADLAKEGVDIDASVKMIQRTIKERLAAQRLKKAGVKRVRILERVKEMRQRLSSGASLSKEEILSQLFGQQGVRPSIAFRKLQEAGESDIRSLIEDDRIVDLMAEENSDDQGA